MRGGSCVVLLVPNSNPINNSHRRGRRAAPLWYTGESAHDASCCECRAQLTDTTLSQMGRVIFLLFLSPVARFVTADLLLRGDEAAVNMGARGKCTLQKVPGDDAPAWTPLLFTTEYSY